MNIVVGCIVKKDNKFLMVKEGHGRCKGMWNFPIGHLEEYETIVEGAKRETLEETGYEVDIDKMLPIIELYQNNKKYILIRFLATPKESYINSDSEQDYNFFTKKIQDKKLIYENVYINPYDNSKVTFLEFQK